MNVMEVLAQVIRDGGQIIPDPEHPRIKVPPHLKALIEENREELRSFIQQKSFSSIPIEVLAHLSQLTLTEFKKETFTLEIRVEWFPHCLWFVPTEADAAHLVSEGESRGRIWTVSELTDLTSTPGLKLEELQTIQAIKEEFGGHLAGVRKAVK